MWFLTQLFQSHPRTRRTSKRALGGLETGLGGALLENRNLLSAGVLHHHHAGEVAHATKSTPSQKASDAPTLENPDVVAGQPWSPVVKYDAKGKDLKNPHGHFSFDNNQTQVPVNFQHSIQKGQHYVIATAQSPHTYDSPGDYDVFLLVQHGDSFKSMKFTITVTAASP